MSIMDSAALRSAAEARLKGCLQSRPSQPEVDWRQLYYELQVKEVELELRNDELRAQQTALEGSLDRYTDLYDFAPIGYLNLTADGRIRLANLTGAKLLGMVRSQLNDHFFSAFVIPSDRQAFERFLLQVFETGSRQVCELGLLKEDGSPMTVRLKALRAPEGAECLLAVLDITEFKQKEAALQQSEDLRARAEALGQVGGWEVDLTTRCVTWTATIHQIHEVEPAFQPTLEQCFNFYEPISRPIIERAIQRAMELAEPFDLDLEIVTAKGNRRRARVIGHADLVRGKVFGFFQDITERKGMELKLNQSEDLRARAEALGRVGGWEFDVATRQLTWTEMVYRLHDLDPAQAPTVEEAINFYAPESRPIIERAVQRAIALGEPFDLDLEIITAKGHRRQVQVIGHADLVRGKVFGFFQDTTERKWAEALRQREARLAAMVNSLVDAVVSADSGGNIVGWNPGAERLFGYQGSDILGQPITLLIPARHHAGHQAGLARVQEGDEYYVNGSSMERHGRRQDGREFPAVLSLSQWSLADEQFYTVIVRDLTEQKQAEEQLRVQSSALAAAANAIVITNRVGKIEWVNPSFTQLTGYSAEEAVGANPRVLKSGQHPPAFYAAMWATISAGNVWHDELVNKRKDGVLYTEEMTITPVRGADAQITHFVAIKQDITERRTLENQLRQAQKMEAIGTLAGGIAHDFNNILSAIIGFCHLLELNSSCDQEARGAIEEIHTAANRATDMVRQIVTFSRKGARKREYIRLDGVIKEAMKFLRASLPAQTKIEMDLEADAPIVLADPTQIYQITLNLAANALYAMEGRPGGLTVSVGLFVPDEEFLSAHPDMQPTPYTRLTVSDTGHGMDAMTMGRIFEPFFTNKPVGKGTGLGLSVVHGIVKSHDGIITVESQVGVGTKFCLYFPGQTQPEALPKPRSSAIPQGSAEKVLVVDDETALTKLLQTVLRRLNYDVTITNTPAEAIRWLRETPSRFDLVITDMSMPEINGLELARQLRAIRPCLPVILTSGYSASVDVDTLHEAGICEVLDKPVTIPALANAVQRSLAKA